MLAAILGGGCGDGGPAPGDGGELPIEVTVQEPVSSPSADEAIELLESAEPPDFDR